VTIERHISELDSLPRQNGELVFAEPWESRAFALAVALAARGAYEWEDFRARLIAEIGAWEREHAHDDRWSYYERWSAALERILLDQAVLTEHEIGARAEELLASIEREHDST
jgi:nitrile hydratase accessory protein